MDRRKFFKVLGVSGAGIAAGSLTGTTLSAMKSLAPQETPETNINEALKYPRTETSMPGKYRGKVVKITDQASVDSNDQPVDSVAYDMVAKGLLLLTGEKKLKKAWRHFVSPKDRIGLKVNPIGGPILSTSHAVTGAIIRQLEESGIPRRNIVIWDRRQEELTASGFTEEKYPGIRIAATETKENDSFYGKDGKLLSLNNIDNNWAYYADVEEEYDAYTLPYMTNQGKYSYFTKICTRELDKIINVPIMKNAGAAVTLCLKNLAFGSITNTSRLHKYHWHHACAQVCAFPPLRDKVVLNIADGLRGCYDGGPGANPQFLCSYNTILVGTDPVAVDRIGHDIIIGRRIAEGRQREDSEKGIVKLKMAQEYGLGTADKASIELIEA